MLPLLGVASVSRGITAQHYVGIMLAALAFHNYAFVLNDIIDLPVDRLHPGRAAYPLVTGRIGIRPAIWFALGQIPIALLVTAWMGARPLAYVALGIAFVLITVYDLWGKLNPFPPLTDFLQSIGWGALVVYGAALVSETLTSLTWWLVATLVVTITVMNGTHGSLRDVRSDRAGGRFTTAMLLGARLDGEQRLIIPARLSAYMFALMVVVAGMFLYPLLTNAFAFPAITWWAVAALLILLQGASLWSTFLLVRQTSRFGLDFLAYTYWHATLLCFPVPFVPYVDWPLRLALLAVFLVPLFVYDYTYRFLLSWGRQVAHLARRS
jgi:4-hydroxybenzoate polyprenyltransferase